MGPTAGTLPACTKAAARRHGAVAVGPHPSLKSASNVCPPLLFTMNTPGW